MPKRPPLTKERVLETATRLADEGGVESLSMRKLGRALGVEAMSLYNHVANKDELLADIVDRVLDEIELPGDDEDWETALRRCAISAHDAFLRHRWAPQLVLSFPGIRPARLRYMEWVLRRLREAGFSAETTYHAYHTLDSHIIGFTLWQLGHSIPAGNLDELAAAFLARFPADDYPYLAEHIHQHLSPDDLGDETEFEFGLELILDGLKRGRSL